MQKQQRRYDISIASSLFEPEQSSRTARFREQDEVLYKVWLYLTGTDLPYVRSVQYALHESLPDPVRFVDRTPSNPSCTISFWTPGEFPVRALITMKDGDTVEAEPHLLRFEQGLKSATDYMAE